jgi:hypothetical protein
MALYPGPRPRQSGSRMKDLIRSKKVTQEYDIKEMADKIRALRQNATELKEMAGGIQAVDRNVDRILACVKMLEININEAADVLGK